jgi:hypothetical protein
LLQQDLYRHLDDAEFLAAKYDEWTEDDAESARALIQDLITVIRCVAAAHEPPTEEPGVCRSCETQWPCAAIITIHRLVKDPDAEFVRLVLKREPF